MTDVTHSGYKAAAQTALSTELNSLANDTWSVLSSEIDNSVTKYMFADIEVNLAAPGAAATGADSAINVYLVPSLDDTNFPTYQASGSAPEQENEQYFVGAVTLTGAASTACRGVIRGVELPAGKFKLGVRNLANDALNASGNTVKWRPWQYASA